MKRSRLSNVFVQRSLPRSRKLHGEPSALLILPWSSIPRQTTARCFSDYYSRISDKKGRKEKQQRAPDLAAITEISHRLTELQENYPRASFASTNLPFLWEAQDDSLVQGRDELLEKVSRIIELLKVRIQTGVIRPDRKYRREVSIIEERLLQHLLSCVMDGHKDVYPVACEILNLMQEFQMEILLAHCEPAMYIAAREGHWSDAAKLFQIQLDLGSMEIPDDPTMGLYCIAKHDKASGALPVESVFEAVSKLTVKSTDGSEKRTFKAHCISPKCSPFLWH